MPAITKFQDACSRWPAPQFWYICTDGVDPSYEKYVTILGALLLFVGLVGVIMSTHWMGDRCKTKAIAVLSPHARAILNAPVVRDGASLHLGDPHADLKVPMHKWCVTRADLQEFKLLVRHAVQEGSLTPTDMDKFDPADTAIGPCIHTVNAQLIKPITEKAGNVSWALMKHPEGLPCDLFITHGWQEGAFEFVDKVDNSWPKGLKHAYVCFLSNPQNLDISSLIQSPLDSPFAKALESAKYMMVVANRKGSIYSRIWCAYEAFLAYSRNKTIFTAKAPEPHFWLRIIRTASVSMLGQGTMAVLLLQAPLVIMLTTLGCVGISFVCINLANLQTIYPSQLEFSRHLRPSSPVLRGLMFAVVFTIGAFSSGIVVLKPLHAVPWIFFLICLGGVCLLQAWRLSHAQARVQTRELMKGYTGRLQDAQSSVQADKDEILKSIAHSGEEEKVNQAVDLLIQSGMSSKQLRQLRERFGTLESGLDIFPYDPVFFAVAQYCALPLTTLFSQPACDVILVVLIFLLMLEGLIATTIALWRPHLRKINTKWIVLSAQVLLTGQLVIFVLAACGFSICFGTKMFYIFADFVFSPLILCALIVGPIRVAGVPFLGGMLAPGGKLAASVRCLRACVRCLRARRETPVHPVLDA